MRIYVAGPISGYDLQERANYFSATTKKWRNMGAEVVNPFECHPVGVTWQEALRSDIKQLVTCDAILLTPGWEKSRGVALELHIAKSLGMTVLQEVTDEGTAPADG